MTDFGIKDGNVGVMKGVILGICASAKIVDLSHTISAQNIREASFVLDKSWSYFPAGTIHVIVVDPGVGTARRPLAALIDEHYFVCPDNGVLTLVLDRSERMNNPVQIVELNQKQYWLPAVSHVFHGRDIFSPCAAHLANGVTLEELGSIMTDPQRIDYPKPTATDRGWLGEVAHIDHFGNIATNVREEHLVDLNKNRMQIKLNEIEIQGLVKTFGERLPGELIALFGSTGNLIISEVNGNAAKRLDTHVGDLVEVKKLD
jgi:hypothetical protein